MNQTQLKEWLKQKEPTKTEAYTAGGIEFLSVVLPDGWTIIFERFGNSYEPTITTAPAGSTTLPSTVF